MFSERKHYALQVPPVVPYKTLEKFPRALCGTTGGNCSARIFRPVSRRAICKKQEFQTLYTNLLLCWYKTLHLPLSRYMWSLYLKPKSQGLWLSPSWRSCLENRPQTPLHSPPADSPGGVRHWHQLFLPPVGQTTFCCRHRRQLASNGRSRSSLCQENCCNVW